MPKVSVIQSCYNHEKYIAEALKDCQLPFDRITANANPVHHITGLEIEK